jgi:hypothetical protein
VRSRLRIALDKYDTDVVDGRASITKAVCSSLNQRDPLQLFLADAAVPIHNNLSERALGVIGLLRKDSLFAGTDDAAQRFAQLLSLLSTCQRPTGTSGACSPGAQRPKGPGSRVQPIPRWWSHP